MTNGTCQGGVLTPYFFSRYIRDLIADIANSDVGCKLSGHFVNILAYADDIFFNRSFVEGIATTVKCFA